MVAAFFELPNTGNKSSVSMFRILPNRLYTVIWRCENKCVNLKPHISTMQCLQLAERGNRAFLIFLSEVKCNPIILKWAVKQLPIIKGIKLLI